jgi:hypothetical protein
MVNGLAILELGADPDAALDSHWRTVMADTRHDDAAFFHKLETDMRPVVTEWLMRQLEGPLDDPHLAMRVATAARALAKRRVLLDTARIKAARLKLPLGRGGFSDYRTTLDRLVTVVESVARGDKCLCPIGFSTVQSHGQLDTLSETVDRKTCTTAWLTRCRVCGRRWRIEESTGYHVPTYDVTELKE